MKQRKICHTNQNYAIGDFAMKHHTLLFRLAAAILFGIAAGGGVAALGLAEHTAFIWLARAATTFTSLFRSFLNFIIPLLIFSFIAVGLADLRGTAGRMAGVTLALAYVSTILAGIAAYAAGAAVLPHIVGVLAAPDTSQTAYEAFFTIEFPPLLGVMSALVLAFVLGIGMAALPGRSLFGAVSDLRDIVAKVLDRIVIPLIPFHVAGIFLTIAAQGRLLSVLQTFAAAFVLILVLQIAFLLLEYGAASLICQKNQFKTLKNVITPYLTALGTQSSAATIPVSLTCAYENGISRDVADFCIPLCATIHLIGDTIALVTGTLALLLADGQEATFGAFLPFILMLGVTMIAAPGVPGGGVMSALGLITSMFGFDAHLQQLIIALHLAQDSFGTAANVTGDQALAMIVDRLEQAAARRREQGR